MYECVEVVPIGWRQNPDGTGRSRWYVLADGSEVTFKGLPIGAMFYDDDCGRADCKRPDGRCLAVKIPSKDGRGSLFYIDHPSSGPGPGWTRTGTPPHVTVNPSVNYVDEWHGWIRDGRLVPA